MKHQPYLFTNSSGEHLLHCRATEEKTEIPFGGNVFEFVAWKIYCDDRNAETPSVVEGCPVVIECCPTLINRDGQWFMTYIAGLNKDAFTPITYRIVEVPFDLEAGAVVAATAVLLMGFPVFTGTRAGGRIIYTSKDAKHVLGKPGDGIALPFKYEAILRLANVFDRAGCFLVTVRDGVVTRSFLFDLDTGKAEPVTNNKGEDVYKCSLLTGRLAYAKKTGPSFEDRDIIIENHHGQTP